MNVTFSAYFPSPYGLFLSWFSSCPTPTNQNTTKTSIKCFRYLLYLQLIALLPAFTPMLYYFHLEFMTQISIMHVSNLKLPLEYINTLKYTHTNLGTDLSKVPHPLVKYDWRYIISGNHNNNFGYLAMYLDITTNLICR